MPEIKGFRAWRFAKEKIKDFSRVVAPPYDVISKKEQAALLRRSPYNVVRLILGKEKSGDNAAHNRYTRAREIFKSWVSSGVLRRDPSPAVYVLVQDYGEQGAPPSQRKTRVGFIAAMRLDERAVRRHEDTLEAPKKDRWALIKEVRANLSPIFGLFEDKKGGVQKILKRAIAQVPPAVDVTLDGIRHRLFVEKRPGILRALSTAMRSKPLFIADGHHRFDVACQFRDWMNSRRAGGRPAGETPAGWNYVMTYFSDYLHNPFSIYPTHRLIRARAGRPLRALARRGVLKKAAALGEVLSALSKSRAADSASGYRFGIYTRKDGFFIFTLHEKFAPSQKAHIAGRLDVSALHEAVIAPCFGIHSIEKSDSIDFTRQADHAVAEVNKGKFHLAFFLRPTSLREMVEVSKRGLKMPQKSTYFYPKLLSGLAFRTLYD